MEIKILLDFGKSLIYIMKRSGPRMEPCGTPVVILIISYSAEVGRVRFICLYSLSRNRIDFNSPLVNHFDFLCLCLLYFTSLPDMCLYVAVTNTSRIFF